MIIEGMEIKIVWSEQYVGGWSHRFSVNGREVGDLVCGSHYDSIELFDEHSKLKSSLEIALFEKRLSSASHFVPELRDALHRLEVSA